VGHRSGFIDVGVAVKVREIAPVCISAALPGCGHIAAGKHFKGLLLFLFFGFALDGFLYGHFQHLLAPEQGTSAAYVVALVAGLGLWAYAVGDTLALAARSRRIEAKADVADAHIRQALAAYLADDYDGAGAALKGALRINPDDPDALFHLGAVHAAAGRPRPAARAFRKCLRCDLDGKWEREVHARLQRLHAPPDAAASTQPAVEESSPPETTGGPS